MKNKSLKILALILALGCVFGMCVTAAAADTPASWAQDDVSAAIRLQLVPPILQSAYDQNITRAEFCALAVALIETLAHESIKITASFSDTDDANVLKIASAGIVEGIGDGKFNPGGDITREQAAKMLTGTARLLGVEDKDTSVIYADQDQLGPWAPAFVKFVTAHRIMNGKDSGFCPRDPYSRQEAIVTMMRMHRLVTDGDTGVPDPDAPVTEPKTLYYVQSDGYGMSEYAPAIALYPDGKFTFRVNLLEAMGQMNGTYSVSGNTYTFTITDKNFSGAWAGSDMKSFTMTYKNDKLTYTSSDSVGDTWKGSVFHLSDTAPKGFK